MSETKRFQHAKDIQKKAEGKYGKDHTTTLGHSLGAKIASDVGDRPVILGKKLSLKHFDGPNYIEVDIDVSSSWAARMLQGVLYMHAHIYAHILNTRWPRN